MKRYRLYIYNTKTAWIRYADGNSASEGPGRVKNVKVGGEDIDPDKKYTVAGIDYSIINNGNGSTAFDGAKVVKNEIMLDNQMLINYLSETLEGRVGEEYEDPSGQGRITIIDAE